MRRHVMTGQLHLDPPTGHWNLNMTDTIFALSSGTIPAGVAVIRVSGPQVDALVRAMTGDLPAPRNAALRCLKDPVTSEILDQALVLLFRAPASFTGEDVVELQCHGGRAVVARVLRVLSDFDGCRPAEPGEFTRRAFYHGRMDLTEVEGLADLIASETEVQRKQAMRQMGGALSTIYNDWSQRIIHMRAMIEADFDFADEEDVPGSVADTVWGQAEDLAVEIAAHLDRSRHGERVRTGLQVVLMGAPNAGKSSLLNALAGREVAIVTEEAGTTRDVIEVHLDLDGYPVTLVDTAGLRATEGVVEREGIRRAVSRSVGADLVLWLEEPGGLVFGDAAPETVKALDDAAVPVWTVRTKQDLETLPKRDSSETSHVIPCSTAKPEGLGPVLTALTQFAEETILLGEVPLATRARHRHLLETCRSHLTDAVSNSQLPGELRAEDLRRAADALGRLTGRIDVEDLLDVIFRDFCIGK